MIVIHLYGQYKKLFGAEFKLQVSSFAAGIRLLEANFKGRFAKMIENDAFHVCEGEYLGKHTNIENIDLAKLEYGKDEVAHYHLIPRAVGGMSSMKKKGLGAILLGTLILGVSFMFGFTPGIYAGLSLIMGGASLLLTPTVETPEEDKRKSYSFSGPGNQDGQGAIQPVVYGKRVRVGSVVAAASIKSIQTKG